MRGEYEHWRLADAIAGRWEYGQWPVTAQEAEQERQRRLYPRLALTSTQDMIVAELGAFDLDNIARLAGLDPWGTAVFCAQLAAAGQEPEDFYRRLGAGEGLLDSSGAVQRDDSPS